MLEYALEGMVAPLPDLRAEDPSEVLSRLVLYESIEDSWSKAECSTTDIPGFCPLSRPRCVSSSGYRICLKVWSRFISTDF